jgi:hypothetical protein
MAVPPGAPPDSTPPRIVVVHPESGAVVPDLRGDAVIQFDRVIDEMASQGGGGGGRTAPPVTGIGRQIILSPVDGRVDASWHRSAINVKPAEGWRPGRVYHLEVLPGIIDLQHNVMKKGAMVIFSTGPALPHAKLSGIVLQWVDKRAMSRGVVRAALLPDTAAYLVFSDSGGEFTIPDVPPGRYHVVAIQDANSNRALDPGEAFDSTTVTLDSSASVVLWAFVHDTTAPRLRGVEMVDSTAFRLMFSEPLAPDAPLDTAHVHVLALPDSTPVALTGVWTNTRYDSIQTRERAIADSLRRLSDTTRAHAPRDTTHARPRSAPVLGGRAAPGAADTGKARIDTALIRKLLASRPVPADQFVGQTVHPLTPGGKYLVRVHRATNLDGKTGDGQALLVIPIPKAVPARRDTTAKRKPKP